MAYTMVAQQPLLRHPLCFRARNLFAPCPLSLHSQCCRLRPRQFPKISQNARGPALPSSFALAGIEIRRVPRSSGEL